MNDRYFHDVELFIDWYDYHDMEEFGDGIEYYGNDGTTLFVPFNHDEKVELSDTVSGTVIKQWEFPESEQARIKQEEQEIIERKELYRRAIKADYISYDRWIELYA